eukprot:6225753-Amphidinium_carterae.1
MVPCGTEERARWLATVRMHLDLVAVGCQLSLVDQSRTTLPWQVSTGKGQSKSTTAPPNYTVETKIITSNLLIFQN